MKVIIAGSRDLDDYAYVDNAVYNTDWIIQEVVSGTARGVDTTAIDWALVNGVPVKEFPADWDKHGKGAGYIRNSQMADYADALIAIWDGKSKGTLNMINEMAKRNKPIYIYCPT